MKSDPIDRQRAIKEIERFDGYLDEDMIHRLKIAIERLPSSQKKGEWIEIDFQDGYMYGFHMCSACGARYNCGFDTPPDWDYCPHCGSKMRGDEA